MFQEWDFLLGEIWLLMLCAILLGLAVGWIFWGGKKPPERDPKLEAELIKLREELEELQSRDRVKALPPPERASDLDLDIVDTNLFDTAVDEGTRPEALSEPRGGKADDLKLIKGIGPQMEVLCNKLGFYHFDQISSWTPEEIAWVDANLEGFKGRVTRDRWVRQAQVLARGGSTEYSAKVKLGDIQY